MLEDLEQKCKITKHLMVIIHIVLNMIKNMKNRNKMMIHIILKLISIKQKKIIKIKSIQKKRNNLSKKDCQLDKKKNQKKKNKKNKKMLYKKSY